MKVRLVFVILAVALVFSSATAMGHDPIEDWAAGIKDQYGGTTITVAVASHPSVEAFKQMIPRFEELTGISVVLDEMEEGQLGQRMLLEVSAESASYDAMMTAIEWSPLVASSGYATPLEPWIESDITPDWFNYEDILQAYRDMFLWEDGMHYGIPYAGETVFMFYREDLFEEHGIDVPTTYDEVLAAAQYFSENVDGVDGISYRARLGWEFTYMWSIFLAPFGGMMVDPATGEVALDSPGTVTSLEYIRDLWQYGPVGVESFSFPEAWDAFMLGRAAIMIEASAAAPEVENPDKSLVAGMTGYSPLPAGPAGAFSGVWGWSFAMMDDSDAKEATWAFIAYLTSEGLQDEYLANGGIVSRASALGDPDLQAENPYYQATLDTLKQAAALGELGLSVVLPTPKWSQISEIMGIEGARAFIGEISVEEAIASMQAQVSEVVSG
ncbi:MAG: sugar ABC transporter substrate-binding protein [Chloroflexota bacterium]|nr:sugar ABC transporter substrate-binding protein [Chloroflexota bacterium]MDE2858797.1 sugar ABC transporter substrate-binding protein [Chloroflexota bacterium]